MESFECFGFIDNSLELNNCSIKAKGLIYKKSCKCCYNKSSINIFNICSNNDLNFFDEYFNGEYLYKKILIISNIYFLQSATSSNKLRSQSQNNIPNKILVKLPNIIIQNIIKYIKLPNICFNEILIWFNFNNINKYKYSCIGSIVDVDTWARKPIVFHEQCEYNNKTKKGKIICPKCFKHIKYSFTETMFADDLLNITDIEIESNDKFYNKKLVEEIYWHYVKLCTAAPGEQL
jgi:hypothetical protein